MRVAVVVFAGLLAASCAKEEPSPAEQERLDQADIAAVQAAQVPPPTPVEPERILYPDIEKHDMFGAGCSFAPRIARKDDRTISEFT